MSSDKKRALGRGLDALLPKSPPPREPEPKLPSSGLFTCPIERIKPQPDQPRQHFDDRELGELAESIKTHGILQPLVVRKLGSDPIRQQYELVAGERRWRAAQRAGLLEVPVIVKDVAPKEAFELALIENLQRADLNPIEVAESYQRLIDEHGLSHETLAARVGKDRSTVTNALRMLRLPPRIRMLVVSRELSEGHARALLGAPDDKQLEAIAEKAIRGKLPVRKVEELVRAAKKGPKADAKAEVKAKSASVRDLEQRLGRRFGARVEVRDKNGAGELAIRYTSLDELDRILGILGPL